MTLYIIAIGGTGGKIVEAVAHLAAAGIYSASASDNSENINVLFVDQDQANGNIAASKTTIEHYEKCSKIFDGNNHLPLMQSKIEYFEECLQSTSGKDKVQLREVFYHDYSENDLVRNLFHVLYSSDERDDDLGEGFHGRPAVGAAFINRVIGDRHNHSKWQEFIDKILVDARGGKVTRVFLCGSIFGGTGAAGFPTLGRLLLNQLNEEKLRNSVKVGGVLMLPYFQFTSQQQQSPQAKIYAKSEEFILNSEAALRYYATNKDLKLDRFYLLGTPELTQVSKSKTGGSEQRNTPHFLELYAAFALLDFLQIGNNNQNNNQQNQDNNQQNQVFLISREKAKAVTWSDIPDRDQVRKKLENAARFAFAWNYAIVPDLEFASEGKALNVVPWSLKFFDRVKLKSQHKQIEEIKNWCQDYLRWLAMIHSETGVELFNVHSFVQDTSEKTLKSDSKEVRNEFRNLLKSSSSVLINDILERLPRMAQKIQPPNGGVVGLAKALYLTLDEKSF
jgi:hypothetical protein